VSCVIEIESMNKTYYTVDGRSIVALKEVNMVTEEGQFVSVVGPSGCGKTTMLKILAGLVPKTEGSVRLRGREVSGPTGDIGFVFQNPVLLPWRTVMSNVMLPIEVLGMVGKDYQQHCQHLLEMTKLVDFGSKYPRELSGGMQQRVSIVRALIHNPALLLMDEPFGALDALTREMLNLELQKIWTQSYKTIVFVTHGIQEAVFLSDVVYVMSPRPGTMLDKVIIDLPRPRDLDIMNTPEFGRYARRIRAQLKGEAQSDL
jgi:NitT/TauT family transport system ATP-binding protein